jgi:cysteine-rich repeat protein
VLRALAALALVTAGCLSADVSRCADGRICPGGSVCVDELPGCWAPDAVDACRGASDGDACSIGESGVCRSGVCIVPECGNFVVDAGEDCDPAEEGADDGCSATCRFEVCGNAIRDPDEACDCGDATILDEDRPAGCRGANGTGGLCTETCALECGNGAVSALEQCDGAPPANLACVDLGFDHGVLGCSAFCTVDAAACRTIGLVPEGTTAIGDFTGAWSDGTRLYAITEDGQLLEHDAIAWLAPVQLSAQTLDGIHGSSPTNIFAVGEAGVAMRFDGTSWAATDTGTTERLHDVWVVSATDAWAAGTNGTVIRWNGSAWSPVAFPAPAAQLFAVWAGDAGVFVGDSESNVWELVGDTFVPTMLDGLVEDLLGRGDRVWAATSNGVREYDGQTWTLAPIPGVFAALWADDDEVFAAGDTGVVAHLDAHGWKSWTRETTDRLRAIAGPRATDLAFFGTNGVVHHYSGTAWIDTDSGTTQDLRDVWYGSTGIVAAGAEGTVVVEDRGAFTTLPQVTLPVPFPHAESLGTVYASSADDITVAGTFTSIQHWDGDAWTNETTGPEYWGELWGLDAERFAIGIGIYAWDPVEGWAVVIDGLDNSEYRAAWGVSSDDFFAIERTGATIDRIVDGGVAEHTVLSTPELRGVWAASLDDAVVVGANTIVRWDGATWTIQPLAHPAALEAVHGADVVVAVGAAGAMVLGDTSGWSPVRTPTIADLAAVWVDASMIYAAGNDGVMLRLLRSTD